MASVRCKREPRFLHARRVIESLPRLWVGYRYISTPCLTALLEPCAEVVYSCIHWNARYMCASKTSRDVARNLLKAGAPARRPSQLLVPQSFIRPGCSGRSTTGSTESLALSAKSRATNSSPPIGNPMLFNASSPLLMLTS